MIAGNIDLSQVTMAMTITLAPLVINANSLVTIATVMIIINSNDYIRKMK